MVLEDLSESTLANMLLCADSLGRTHEQYVAPICTPCRPIVTVSDGDAALRHARLLWERHAFAPYDDRDFVASCIGVSYRAAERLRPTDLNTRVDHAVFRFASSADTTRVAAIVGLDSLLDSLRRAGNDTQAALLLDRFARAVWARTQRLLERPLALPLSAVEEQQRRLPRMPHAPTVLPTMQRPSAAPGESEALWCSQLFGLAATWTSDAAARAMRQRLAIAPLVVLEKWSAIDAAARATLERAPTDSIARVALALARYRLMHRPVFQSDAVMASFDSALAVMSRIDSARYDSFDDVLTRADDEWRYGFLPTDRRTLDVRAWAIVDPLWSTPVNEIRLARRARVADADFRYADLIDAGESGSETNAGRLQVKLGVIDARWRVERARSVSRAWLTRGWSSHQQTIGLTMSDEEWMIFHHPRFGAEALSRLPVTQTFSMCSGLTGRLPSMRNCAELSRAEWPEVPFAAELDTIDVNAARFRRMGANAGADSVDIYLGARVPLRRFPSTDSYEVTPHDRITLSAWLVSTGGEPIFSAAEQRALPKAAERAWTAQWTTRVHTGALLHRVEAMEPTRVAGARGAAIFTADAQAELTTRGFGLSDVLVAASARATRQPAARWSDLAIVPNGGVVAPGAQFAMAWEVYDLQPASDGRVRWRVEIRRERGSVQRDDARALIAAQRTAGTRLTSQEPDAPALAYNRDAAAAPVVLDQLTFSLSDAPPGRHMVQVTITDLVSGATATRTVSMRVLASDAQPRVR
jgi:hypothetical protein